MGSLIVRFPLFLIRIHDLVFELIKAAVKSSTGDDVVLEIYPLPKGVSQPDHTTRLGFTVENLDNLAATLQSQGARIVTPPARTEWGYTAVVEDLDGRKIELTEKS